MEAIDNAVPDLNYVDFSVDAVAEPYLDAAGAVARSMDVQSPLNLPPAALRLAASRVDELGVAELIGALDATSEAMPVLFHMARVLAHGNVEATWRSLVGVPALLLDIDERIERLALPAGDGAGQWTLWLPDSAALSDLSVGLLQVDSIVQVQGQTTGDSHRQGLLGFNEGSLIQLEHRAHREDRVIGITTEQRDRYLRAEQVLLLGMIVGVCWRLSEDAQAYAKERMSAGKPIAQHQAVALRLGDIALDYQALSLYCTAQIGTDGQYSALVCQYVEATAFRIARDCVQIAAAHGYVEGLPFKRHYEQVRTLASALVSLPLPSSTRKA